jgi:hypothetical protein
MAEEIVGGLKEIKTELREINNQLLQVDRGSAEFVKLSQRAGDLKDKIKDVGEAVRNNAGPAVESLGNNLGTAFGQLKDLDFEGFGESLKAIGGNIGRIDFKTVKDGISSMASGFASLGKALLTNPFFLIAGAIALIAMNFDKVLSAFPALESGLKGINKEQKELAKSAEDRAKASKTAYENIDKQTNILKMQGKSEKDIALMKLNALKTAISEAETRLGISREQAKSQIDAAKRNREILDGVIQFLTAPLQVLLGTVDAIGNALGQDFNLRGGLNDMLGDLIIDPDQLSADLDKGIKEQEQALEQMKNDYAGIQLQIRAIDQKTADDKAKANEEANKKIEEDAKKKAEEDKKRAQEVYDAEKKANEDRIKSEQDHWEARQFLIRDAKEKEIDELVAKYDEIFEKAGEDAELEKQLTEQRRADIAAINKKYNDAEVKATEEAEKKKADAKIQGIQKNLQMASQAVGILMSLNEATAKGDKASAKRAFKRNKNLQKALAVINMASGVVSAFSAPDNVTFIQKGIAAAAVLATGTANIVKINQSKFEEESGDTGGGGGGGNNSLSTSGGGNATPTQPQAMNLGFLSNRNTGPQPLQAYVLAGHVQDGLNAQERVKNQAQLTQ